MRSTHRTRTIAGLVAGALGLLLVYFAASSGGGGTADAAVTTTTAAETTTTTGGTTTTTGATTSTTGGATTTTAAATTTTAGSGDAELLALGEEVFLHTAGGVGCAYCHGVDGKGDADLAAPDIRGKDYVSVTDALLTRAQMTFITLTDPEIKAVVAYLATLP